jgi:hypothetical protein
MSKPRERKPRKARGAGRVPSAAKVNGLPAAALAFVHEYDGNGGNGTRAYLQVHPKVKPETAATEAWKLLRIPKVAEALAELRAARWARLKMNGDEAMALLSNDARADIRELFGEGWAMLPPDQWPDSVARSVKGIRPGVAGTTVLLNDSLAARRIILEQTGQIKNPAAELGATLARILAGKYTEEQEG